MNKLIEDEKWNIGKESYCFVRENIRYILLSLPFYLSCYHLQQHFPFSISHYCNSILESQIMNK